MALKAVLALAVFVFYSAITMSHAGFANIVFEESDAAGLESAAQASASVRVEGNNQAELTLIVVPLTVSQYMAQPAVYDNQCDRVIERTNNDPAEEGDFNPTPVEQVVASDATDLTGIASYTMTVAITDDNTQEPLEYFLMWLNASQPDGTDTITYGRRCIRVDIEVDSRDEVELSVIQFITEVNEDAGTVELMRIDKIGETELPVEVLFSGSRPGIFLIVQSITLQPSDTSAVVNVTIVDDDVPENNDEQLVVATSGSLVTKEVRFTVKDNDVVTLGFTTSEVTVTEGENVELTVQIMNGVTSDRTEFFRIFTDRGKGNATVDVHYTAMDNPSYFPGDQIVIPTIDDDMLERSRQFEVRVEDPNSNPLNVLDPNHVIVTVRDNDGTPNTPTVTSIELNRTSDLRGNVSVTWNINKNYLRPVERYVIIFQVTSSSEAKPKDKDDTKGDGEGDDNGGGEVEVERRQFNVTVNADDIVCKQNATGSVCQHIVPDNSTIGSTYSVIICAENEFGTTCGETTVVTPTAASLVPGERGLPPGTVAGIVIAVLLGILMCCLLWIVVFFVIFCCFCGGEREKTYFPEKRERENQKLQEKYDRIKTSESPDPPNIYADDDIPV